MIAEALEAVRILSVKAAAPLKTIETPRESITVNSEGKETAVCIPVKPRDHNVGTLGDLIQLAKRFTEAEDTSDITGTPVVWYDDLAVVLVIDDMGHRVDRATLKLERSDLFAILVGLRRDPRAAWKDPKEFVRLIRIDLAGAFTSTELLEAVRKVKFENGTTTTAESARNRESLGREITSKLEQPVPEEVVLEVPVFKNPGLTSRFPVRCTVEPDPMAGKFQLLPLPDEIERVIQFAVAMIADRLNHELPETVPAYHGKPE